MKRGKEGSCEERERKVAVKRGKGRQLQIEGNEGSQERRQP